MSMNYSDFIREFKHVYDQGLPGRKAQRRMKPYVGMDRNVDVPIPFNAKESAIMALFVPIQNKPHLLLMKRPPYNGVHGGQISFPGGKREKSDADLMDTAYRETREEMGIEPQEIHLMGHLTDLYVMPSNFIIKPYIGYLEKRPIYNIDPVEVESLIEAPMTTFLDETYIKEKVIRSKIGIDVNAPYFELDEGDLWGATAMMVSEIAALSAHFLK